MRHQFVTSFLVMLLTMLTSCNNSAPTNIAPPIISSTFTAIATTTAIEIAPTSTHAAVFATKSLSTQELTESSWNNIINLTQQAESTANVTTQQVNIALATQFPQTCYSSYPSLSPDKNWLAVNCESDEQIRIANKEGNKVWNINYKTLFNPPTDMQMSINAWIDHWSKDSSYVYIGWSICCWDPGGFAYYSNSNIERVNMKSGIIENVISGNMNYSFSPTDRRLIEIREPASLIVLNIHDLITREVTKLNLKLDPVYDQAGLITWSPDGLRFVIVAAHSTGTTDITQTMLLIDVKKLTQKILLRDIRDEIDALNWSENNILSYTTTNYSGSVPVITTWIKDMNTLQPVLPTSTP